MFKPNKYTTWYFSIVDRARKRATIEGYSEKHHIIPKSIGGSNKTSNLVSLTPKEHFICHWLLIKMTDGEDKKKMSYAIWAMTRGSSKHNRVVSSAQYEVARRHFSSINKKKKVSSETRAKMSVSQKGKSRPYKGCFDNSRMRVKVWEITYPTGQIVVLANLAKFCREHNLSQGNLTGGRKSKGFTAICVGEILEPRFKNRKQIPSDASSDSSSDN